MCVYIYTHIYVYIFFFYVYAYIYIGLIRQVAALSAGVGVMVHVILLDRFLLAALSSLA